MAPIGVFPGYFSFSKVLATSYCFLEKKIKFIKFYTKFHVKQAKYSEIACIFSKMLKHSARKLTPRNPFIVNLFALESENNQKMMKEFSFGTPCGVLTCLLTLNLRTMSIGVFPDYFSFSYFLAISFLEKKIKFIKFCTKLHVKQARFFLFKCTSLLLRGKPVQRNCLLFFKNFKKTPVRALRVK